MNHNDIGRSRKCVKYRAHKMYCTLRYTASTMGVGRDVYAYRWCIDGDRTNGKDKSAQFIIEYVGV